MSFSNNKKNNKNIETKTRDGNKEAKEVSKKQIAIGRKLQWRRMVEYKIRQLDEKVKERRKKIFKSLHQTSYNNLMTSFFVVADIFY